MWEPAFGEVPLPDGDPEWPLVLVAPSTSQDPDQQLLRAAVQGLADEPVRVLATWNRRVPRRALRRVGDNTRLVEWVSYARTMPRCDAVICHAGHGTLARALASGCVVVAVPAAGDMNENAARVDWAGAGVRLPGRFVRPGAVRLALARALGEPHRRERARQLAAWAGVADPGQRAAQLLEAMVADEAVRPAAACPAPAS
jgi:UDP:flavonoid glycosyltransferase YjiC (YdhE family)